MPDLEVYLDLIRRQLAHCPPEVMAELGQHISESAAAFRAEGHSPDEAMAMAIGDFGDPAEIAAGLAACCPKGGIAMFRRVGVPALMATGACVAIAFLETMVGYVSRIGRDALAPGSLGLMWPVLPDLYWLVFIVVFLAVHRCASRGGSRRECLLVGAAPALFGVIAYGAVVLVAAGPDAVLYGMGMVGRATLLGRDTLGSVVAARAYLADLLSLTATCLGATWLYFFAVDRLLRRAPQPASE